MSALSDEIRVVVREELDRALREFRAVASSATEDTGLINYGRAGEIADVTSATIGLWVRQGRLRRYGAKRAPLVKRAELVALLETMSRPSRVSADDRAAALMGDAR